MPTEQLDPPQESPNTSQESLLEATNQLAVAFHDTWRNSRLTETGGYLPKIEITEDKLWIESHGTDKLDLANTNYQDLPEDWKTENRDAAATIVSIIDRYDGNIDLTNPIQRSEIGREVHDAWLQRNKAVFHTHNIEPGQTVTFGELPPQEQEKDLEQVIVGLKLFEQLGLAQIGQNQEVRLDQSKPPELKPEVEAEQKAEMEEEAREGINEATASPDYHSAKLPELEEKPIPHNFLEAQYPAIAEAAKNAESRPRYKLDLKKGAWAFADKEAQEWYMQALDDEVAGVWAVLNEKLGLDPNKFPVKSIKFWLPAKAEKLALTSKARNIWHSRKLKQIGFIDKKSISPPVAYAGKEGILLNKSVINMQVEGNPKHPDPATLIHEITHAAMDSIGVDRSPKRHHQATFLSEGLATMAELYLAEHLNGGKIKLEKPGEPLSTFIRERPNAGEIWNWYSYNQENAVLHQYLWEQLGGSEKIKQLSHEAKKAKSNQDLMAAYQSVYGEGLGELSDSARAWYESKS